MQIVTERMSDRFAKYHLNRDSDAPWPFTPLLHHFTAPDVGDPHDHPWGFESFVLRGGYVEEVFHRNDDGTWRSEFVERFPGTSHRVAATDIHRIVELPRGECWTFVIPGPREREVKFWRFDAGKAQRRMWNSSDFTG